MHCHQKDSNLLSTSNHYNLYDDLSNVQIAGRILNWLVPDLQNQNVSNVIRGISVNGDGRVEIAELVLPSEDYSLISMGLHFWYRNDRGEQEIEFDIEIPDPALSIDQILSQAFAHAAVMQSSQRGKQFLGDDFSNLKPSYTIWLLVDPPKQYRGTVNRFSVSQHTEAGGYLYPYKSTEFIYILGLTDPPGDHPYYSLMRMLWILFGDQSKSPEERRLKLKAELKAELSTFIHQERRPEFDLLSEYGDSRYQDGLEEGREEGITLAHQSWLQQTLTLLQSLKENNQLKDDVLRILEATCPDKSYLPLIRKAAGG